MSTEPLYRIEGRDIMGLDEQGGYYMRHVQAMTSEGLHWKSDIAAELGWRDAEIDRLKAAVEQARGDALNEAALRRIIGKALADVQQAQRICNWWEIGSFDGGAMSRVKESLASADETLSKALP